MAIQANYAWATWAAAYKTSTIRQLLHRNPSPCAWAFTSPAHGLAPSIREGRVKSRHRTVKAAQTDLGALCMPERGTVIVPPGIGKASFLVRNIARRILQVPAGVGTRRPAGKGQP